MPDLGRFITLDLAFDDGDRLPLVITEPILVPGSLLLIDPGHPWDPITSARISTPAPNLAHEYAAAMVGYSCDRFSLGGIMVQEGSSTLVASELTGKGGLHLVAASSSFAGAKIGIDAADVLAGYLNSSYDHDMFVGMSHRITRAATGAGHRAYSAATQIDARSLWAFDASGDLPPSGAPARIGYDRTGVADTATGVAYRAVGTRRIHSTYGTFTAPFDEIELAKAGRNSNWEVSAATVQPSWILYSLYVEDLTISGRSFATVNAIFKDRHDALFAAGGRYADDTWTDPATLRA